MFLSHYQSFKLSEQAQIAACFPDIFIPRDADSHKGTYGTLAVIGGAAGMSGAVILAGTAALYNGCGKVWAGFNQNMLPLPVIPEHPEIMLATAAVLQQRQDISAWAVGCGLDVCGDAFHIVQSRLEADSDKPLLLDADALNLLAQHRVELTKSAQKYHTLVLTPHPAEAARLLGITTVEIQADRTAAVQRISQMFQAYTVLKGNQTLVCDPNGNLYTNHSGNPGLGTAGSGDVLSGIIGSLLAQGIETWQAVCGGVWLHGAAADVLRDSEIGEIGILAGEVAPAVRWLRNQITRIHYPANGASD